MSILILMPEYCVFVDYHDKEDIETLILNIDPPYEIDKKIIKQVVDDILVSLGIFKYE